MSGFSADWLSLRADADARARSARITARTAAWALARTHVTGRPLSIVDLGCGTGSNLRFLAPRLPVSQHWLMADHDPDLLVLACRAASGCRRVRALEAVELDLATAPLARLLADADLVTASALFDLVEPGWAAGLVAALARPGRALLAVLTYDGRMTLAPADPFDAHLRCLVNKHQRTDKGFGRPALGPLAADWLCRQARLSGAHVLTARSDWRLAPADQALQQALLDGWADAACAIAPDTADGIAAWHASRLETLRRQGLVTVVGHRDLFAHW
ncbi:MAG: class I SAM-dependent methyltransferase [Defluviicoccus sp.]